MDKATMAIFAAAIPTPDQIARLSPGQIARLSPDQIARLSPYQIARLSPYQIARLSPYQIAWLSPGQIARLSPDQIARLSPYQIARLSPYQIAGFSPDQIAGFSPGQIAGLSPDQIARLSPYQIARLSPGLEVLPVERLYSRMLEDIRSAGRLLRQSTFGPETPPETLCGTPMCIGGHTVNLAGEAGYALKDRFGFAVAATLIHWRSRPDVSPPRYDVYPGEWALAYIEERAAEECGAA